MTGDQEKRQISKRRRQMRHQESIVADGKKREGELFLSIVIIADASLPLFSSFQVLAQSVIGQKYGRSKVSNGFQTMIFDQNGFEKAAMNGSDDDDGEMWKG